MSSRSGWFSLEGELAMPVCRVTGCASRGCAGWALVSAALTACTWGEKKRGPARISPVVCAQGATNADCKDVASGPVTSTMVSRQFSGACAWPSHLSPIAMPP
jgi:hypothetical protein